MCIFAPKSSNMKIDFQYSTDFYGMNAKELSDTCMHLLFYRELMGSLCLTMMYDIFEPVAQRLPPESAAEKGVI